jgi:putative hydrolase of the HAD superfamily
VNRKSKTSVIRAVTFDVGGTLIEPFPSVGAVYAEVARQFGLDCCAETLTRQFRDFWSGRTRFEYTRQEWFEVVQHSFRGFGTVTHELFAEVYARFSEAAAWRLFDDALPALDALRERGLRLAVISNWDDRLEPLLEKLGLREQFEHLSVSGKLGCHKPDAAIFEHTVQALGLKPENVLHVGDSEREDVGGARSAGFRPIRIRRAGPEEPHDIRELTELARLVEH